MACRLSLPSPNYPSLPKLLNCRLHDSRPKHRISFPPLQTRQRPICYLAVDGQEEEKKQESALVDGGGLDQNTQDPQMLGYEEVKDLGVKAALSVLKFYKREISPLLLSSCRYVPTCSEYSMKAYKKYGFLKGTILTAWRLCRCNPLGGYGFDPPRWFDEKRPLEE